MPNNPGAAENATVNRGKSGIRQAFAAMLCCLIGADALLAADLLTIDNGSAKVGIDREKGGAITWLSSPAYAQNIVNIAGPRPTDSTILLRWLQT